MIKHIVISTGKRCTSKTPKKTAAYTDKKNKI